MPHRVQCDVCGAKSGYVDSPLAMTDREHRMVREFVREHDANCQPGAAVPETPPTQCGPFGSPKSPPQSVRKPHGHFQYTGPYGEIQDGDTLSCCHCGRHWEVRVGSGAERGFCTRCMGYVCGPTCYECVPKERRLENVEAGRPLLTPTPATVCVPALAGIDPSTFEVSPGGLLVPAGVTATGGETHESEGEGGGAGPAGPA